MGWHAGNWWPAQNPRWPAYLRAHQDRKPVYLCSSALCLLGRHQVGLLTVPRTRLGLFLGRGESCPPSQVCAGAGLGLLACLPPHPLLQAESSWGLTRLQIRAFFQASPSSCQVSSYPLATLVSLGLACLPRQCPPPKAFASDHLFISAMYPQPFVGRSTDMTPLPS